MGVKSRLKYTINSIYKFVLCPSLGVKWRALLRVKCVELGGVGVPCPVPCQGDEAGAGGTLVLVLAGYTSPSSQWTDKQSENITPRTSYASGN